MANSDTACRHIHPGPPPGPGVAAGAPEQRVETAAETTRRLIKRQLAGLPVFSGVPERDLDRIASMVNRKWMPAGYRIVMAHGHDDVAYLVVRGVVKVIEDTEDGSEVILNILGAGDVIESERQGGGSARSASLVALEPCVLAIIPRSTFDECLRTMPALACNLLSMWSQRLRAADERIQALASTHVEARLARVLLDLGRRLGAREDGGIRIPFRLTQAELGSMVGASRVRINHTLGYLRKSGAIVMDGQHIVIADETLLMSAAVQPMPSDGRQSKPVY